MEDHEAADSAEALAEVDLAEAHAASAEADTADTMVDTMADSDMDLITVLTIIITDHSSLEATDPITATAAVVALAVCSVCLWLPSLYYLW